MGYGISAGHKKTVEAAQTILDNGGNAVDAAIAALWMMCVSEPCMASIGAGGFAMIKYENKTSCLDFFCQTPRSKRRSDELDFYPFTVDFGSTTEDFYIGRGSAATPGFVDGIFAMHEAYGTIPMKELVIPAIETARNGLKLDKFQAYDWNLLRDMFAVATSMRDVYFNEDGIKKENDWVQMPELADIVEILAIEGKDLFYRGEIAQSIAKDFEGDGSLFMDDFINYNAVWRKPISYQWMDNFVHTTAQPSFGGVILTAVLKELERDTFLAKLSSDHFNAWGDVMKKISLIKGDKEQLIGHINSKFNMNIDHMDLGGSGTKGTSHFNIVDKDQNAVSLTVSIGEGSGYVIPNTQMIMNNMLGEAALLPGGFHTWAPDKRLMSMMTPTIVNDLNNDTKMVLGSGGAGRIPFVMAQTIMYAIQYELDLYEAVHSPRVHYDGELLQVENGFDLQNAKFPYNEWDDKSLYFGGAHSIMCKGDKLEAVSDGRRSGCSLVKE